MHKKSPKFLNFGLFFSIQYQLKVFTDHFYTSM